MHGPDEDEPDVAPEAVSTLEDVAALARALPNFLDDASRASLRRAFARYHPDGASALDAAAPELLPLPPPPLSPATPRVSLGRSQA